MLRRNTEEEHTEAEEVIETVESEESSEAVESEETEESVEEQTEEEITMAELELLKKLEEANRLIECDTKSLSCLSVAGGGAVPKVVSGHSRSSSLASQASVQSGGSQEQQGDDLWLRWSDILKTWDRRRTANVKELVRQGIPHHFRGMAWQVLCEAHQSQDKAKYSALLRTQSACEKVIRRDIARTYPEHDFFKKKGGVGQESLFNVMKAYSIHDREVGYCQGSAFIVGLLLMEVRNGLNIS